MNKILCIQFRYDDHACEDEQRSIVEKIDNSEIELAFLNALTERVNWSDPVHVINGCAGVILGGSGELYFDGGRALSDPARDSTIALAGEMRPFLQFLVEKQIPTLGICLGHQLLAFAHGTDVRRCEETGKTGTFTVRRNGNAHEDPVFGDLPEEFAAQYGHKDIVTTVPKNATLLIAAPNCHVGAIRYGASVYSTQFHPELSSKDVRERMERYPEYLPDDIHINDIFDETPHAHRVLENFARFVVTRAHHQQNSGGECTDGKTKRP